MSDELSISRSIPRYIARDTASEANAAGGNASRLAGLDVKDLAIIATVRLFKQVTTDQLLRLYFSEPHTSPASRGVRARRKLRSLVDRGYIARMPRTTGGASGGSGSFIYYPVGTKPRQPNLHTIDITELYVRLRADQFVPEDREHWLKPDAYVQVGKRIYYVEVDRGSEYKTQLKEKMRSYQRAYLKATGSFPQVVYVVTFDPLGLQRRVEFIHDIAKKMEVPELFWVCTMDEFVRANSDN